MNMKIKIDECLIRKLMSYIDHDKVNLATTDKMKEITKLFEKIELIIEKEKGCR